MKFVTVLSATSSTPAIANDHPKVSPELAENLVRYLKGGKLLQASRGFDPDLLNPEATPNVRRTTTTDGVYIWGDSEVYYIGKYQLSPGAEFIKYCEGRDFVTRVPTAQEITQAIVLLDRN